MKRTLTILTTSLIALTSAKEVQADAWKSGFYVGAQGGVIHTKDKFTTIFDGLTSGTAVKSKSDNNITAGPFFGYNHFLKNRAFIGFELAGAFYNTKTRWVEHGTFGEYAHHTLQARYSIQPAIHLGYGFNDSFAGYVKLGVDWANYRYKIRTDQEVSITKKAFKKHFMPGIGLNYHISNRLDTRLETTWSLKSGKLKKKVEEDEAGEPTGIVKPANFAVKLGLIYKI